MPHSRSSSRLLPFLLLLCLCLLTAISAQSVLDPAKLPQCALSCQTLLTAQQACVPPAAPVSSQAIYQSCFCQSNFMVQYKAGQASPMCDAACTSTADRNQILQWYQGLCATGAAVATPNGGTGTSTSSSEEATSTSNQANSSNSGDGSGKKSSWLSIHYRWIIMIVILFVAGILGIIFALWLKRRHDRKWATGGYGRDTMLTHADAAASLANPHPDTPQSVSQVDLSRQQHVYGGRASKAFDGAGYGGPGGHMKETDGAQPPRPSSRRQQRTRDAEDVYQEADFPRQPSSRLSKTKPKSKGDDFY